MFKHLYFLIMSFTIFWSVKAEAKDAVNIYSQVREVPIHEIIHQSGKRYRLSDFKGEFTIAVFWSRECGPCIAELKGLNKFYKDALQSGIRLLLISDNREWKSVEEHRKFLIRYGAPDIEFYVDEQGQAASDLGIFTSPHTVLINTEGKEMGRIRGSADWGNEKMIEYMEDLKKKYG